MHSKPLASRDRVQPRDRAPHGFLRRESSTHCCCRRASRWASRRLETLRSVNADKLAEVDRIGRYRVIRPLGQGGMGQVFLAVDEALERNVALKLLHFGPTSGGLQTEAKALAALSHPGIVT